MNELLTDFSWHVFRSSLFLSLSACVAAAGVTLLRTRSQRTTAIVWSMVLLAGLLIVPARLDIPWYAEASSGTNTSQAVPALARESKPPRPLQASASAQNQTAPSPPAGRTVLRDQNQTDATSKTSAIWIATGESGAEVIWEALPVVWMIGLLIIAAVSLASYTGLLWALRHTWLPQRSWQREHDEAAECLGIHSPPKLVVHAHLGPLICMTPRGHRLVIPSDQWSSLRREQRDVILKHELAHFIRRDVWRTVPARLIVLLHWYNPFAWLAAQRVDETAEWAADEIALRDNPQATGDLASALLQLSQHTQCSRLFASAARGRSLTKRLKNLIEQTETTGDEPMGRRMALVITMALVLLAGAVQIRLVAQESDPSDRAPETARVTIKTAVEFASKLVGEDDLTQQLKASLQTESGALVLRDRAGYYQAIAREEARAQSVERLFDELFESSGTGLQLRVGNEPFRAEYLAASRVLDADIAALKSALAEKAELIDLETDLDKLIHRFMTDDAAPIILYARQLRPQMRPGSQFMEMLFGMQLAKRRDGMYAVRPDARDEIDQRMKIYDQRGKFLLRAKQDLAEFADEITPVDELHVRLQAVLKDPLIATRLGLSIFEGDHLNRRVVDGVVNQFEGAMREGAEGMIIQDQAKDHIERMLPGLERIKKVADSIRAPLNAFAAKVAEEDDFHRRYKQILTSDLVLVRTASRVQYANADIQTTVDRYFSTILNEKENGRFSAGSANVREEQLVAMVSGIFREARVAKRKGREVTEYIEQVVDPELREAMLSPGGKIAIGDELQKRYLGNSTDGLGQWISEHFDPSGNGYAIREDRRDEVEEFVNHVAEVTRELKNADF